MQLVINDKNEITAYATVGDIGGIECTGDIPDNFYSDFKPAFFLLKDGKICENSNYVNPVTNLPTGPTSLEKIVMQQSIKIAQIQQMLMQQNEEIAKLKGVNA